MRDFSSKLKKGTILLVEDSADDAALLVRELQNANISSTVQIVSDGNEAIAYLSGTERYSDRKSYPLPFLVFLDLRLPRCDGFQVLSWVREQPELESIPFVILTVSQDGLDHQKAYALGAKWYLVKPPSPGELLRLADSLSNFWNNLEKAERKE